MVLKAMTDEANRTENLGHESLDVREKPSLGSTSLPVLEY
jgi:hypothetical protein